ncbi:MAG: molybdopterin-binding protein [Bacteroidia bacterium]|nr:molybdopterin-binding protein [Bacteroidia bacterium]
MRNLINPLLLCFTIVLTGWYHYEPQPTNSFSITGKVKNELTLTLSDLISIGGKPVGNILITNHRGEVKEEIKQATGVPLKPLLTKAGIFTYKPHELNTFYIVCISADTHQVVFSWNELFNTEVGNNVYLITEKNGVKLKDMSERILLISKSDSLSGRRYLKNLKEIRVERVN